MEEVNPCIPRTPQNRDEAGRFIRGMSGNPGGRPKGMGVYILEQTNEGKEMVDFMLQLLRGELTNDLRVQAQAATWLADRSLGRPAVQQAVEASKYNSTMPLINGHDPINLLNEKSELLRERLLGE